MEVGDGREKCCKGEAVCHSLSISGSVPSVLHRHPSAAVGHSLVSPALPIWVSTWKLYLNLQTQTHFAPEQL